MTFRVSDLMVRPIAAAPTKPDKVPRGEQPLCAACTRMTECGACSACTQCSLCTACTVCTCTRCSLTAMSTCTGVTDADKCTCLNTSARNLSLLQAALQSRVQGVYAAPIGV